MNIIKLLLGLLVSFVAISCSKDSPTEPEFTFFEIQGENGFVGTVNGTNAFISLLIGDNEGIVYVCNGDEEISEWFKGSIVDPTNIIFTNYDGAKISAKFENNSFIGEVTLSTDVKQSFSAQPSRNENSGIYRVMGEEATTDNLYAGWILNSEGIEKGSVRIGSKFQNAIALPQNSAIINNKSYPVFQFIVKKPTPPAPFVPVPYPNIGKN